MSILKPDDGIGKSGGNGGDNQSIKQDLSVNFSDPTVYEKLTRIKDSPHLLVMDCIQPFKELVDLFCSNHIPVAQRELCVQLRRFFRERVLILYSENWFEESENLLEKDKLEILHASLERWIKEFILEGKFGKLEKVSAKYGRFSSEIVFQGVNKKHIFKGNILVKETIAEIFLLNAVAKYLKKPLIDCKDVSTELIPLQSVD